MMSWTVTPCAVLLTNSISLRGFALLRVEARGLWFLKEMGAAAALPQKCGSEFGVSRGEEFKQRKSAMNRRAMERICIFLVINFLGTVRRIVSYRRELRNEDLLTENRNYFVVFVVSRFVFL